MIKSSLKPNSFVELSDSGERPYWADNYPSLVPKSLFPKLGDLPIKRADVPLSEETTPLIAHKMEGILDFCSSNPVLAPYKKSFISPELADWLTSHPTHSSLENEEVAEYIKHGITLKTPTNSIPITDSALKSPLEHNTCTISDLLKGCTKNGGYLGPINYTNQTHALISFTDYKGRSWVTLNKLNPGLDIFRVKEAKRQMEYAGRLVANMTKNLINDDYSFQERTIDMPSFKDQPTDNCDSRIRTTATCHSSTISNAAGRDDLEPSYDGTTPVLPTQTL